MTRDLTPFGLAGTVVPPVEVRKPDLVRLSRELERQALADPPRAVAAALQDSRFVTDRTRASYAALAAAGCPVRLHARGLQSWLGEGVAGIALDDDDPLVDEWVVVVPGRVLLAAADLHRPGVDDDGRAFRLALTREPEVVGAAARLLGV